jgi:hypothetical protein
MDDASESIPIEDIVGAAQQSSALDVLVPIAFFAVITFLIGLLVWSIFVTRRGLAAQRSAVGQYQFALDRQEEAMALTRRGVELAERSVKQQEEIIHLLRRLAEPNG